MSVPSIPRPGGHDAPPPPPRRNGVLTALMVIAGIVLLLPGLCALVFAGMLGGAGGALAGLWLVCLLISAGGVTLIVKAFR